jgi:hypothetical protein
VQFAAGNSRADYVTGGQNVSESSQRYGEQLKTYTTNYSRAVELFNDTIKRGAVIGIKQLTETDFMLWWFPKMQQPATTRKL